MKWRKKYKTDEQEIMKQTKKKIKQPGREKNISPMSMKR